MEHFTLLLSEPISVPTAADETDPFTAILTRDWASVGGWSLFVGLCLLIVLGAFREWWVPGCRYRRLEDAAEKQSETLNTTATALEKQVVANEITKHFFEETIPKRGEV